MPTTLTETSTFDTPIVVPASGDARTAASVDAAFQKLANRTKYLNDAVIGLTAGFANFPGLLIGPRNAYSSNGTDIIVESFRARRIGATAYGEQAATTVTPGSDSNSTWHYLYAKDDGGGGIAYERSTTAPSASQTYKPGDATREYVLSYYVGSSGSILAFRKVGNKYIWRRSGYSTFPFNVLSGGNATSYTTRSCSSTVAPHGRIAGFIAELAADPSGATAFVITNGDSASNNVYAVHAAPSTIVNAYFEMELNASREFQYKVDDAGAGLDLEVTHWYE